jgi:hypothetical protein
MSSASIGPRDSEAPRPARSIRRVIQLISRELNGHNSVLDQADGGPE